MTRSSQSLCFVCRSCRQSYARAIPQTRSFSNTPSRLQTIPSFQETSSPELNALFADWRRRVFTPAVLNTTHRALVYKKSRHAILENDPGVTVTMSDGEDVKLKPLNAFDKPNKRDSFRQIVSILVYSNDEDVWAQLPAFLEGMQLAREPVPAWFLERLTRKANEQGRAGVMKKCAMMFKKTGLSLSTKTVTRELFLGSHERFVEARTLGEDYSDEAHFAESLALMLESPGHCGGTIHYAKGQVDMRRDLTVLGVLLEFAAAKSIDAPQDRDLEAKTGNYCRKLVAMAGNDILRREDKALPERAMENWIPIANRIRLALQMDGMGDNMSKDDEENLRKSLKRKLKELDGAIQNAAAEVRADANGKSRRALVMLENTQQSPS